ncbi:BLOC-1-related complex subunit 6 [Trichonephila inaurata madagascariensis]|uniref:BLOC-1-related complex subunit 6 n=1 Tax=Trichonephila inaurata madagascariensis TaxID=2747483 RepID=A0A8X7CJD8_9ARAC|nr:BLOC-1-related complex subunit 6 [Trichonephila inaurata madagascariensis]
MNEKDLCGALDNTSRKKDEENLGNSNSTFGVPEQFSEPYSVQNSDELNIHSKPTERSTQINVDQEGYRENVMTGSYEAISLDHDFLKSDSTSSKESEMRRHSDESENKDINPVKQVGENLGYLNISSRNQETLSALEHGDSQRVAESNLEDSEQDDCDEDVMTGSYGEISLDRDLINCDKNSDSLSSRDDERCFLDESKYDSSHNDAKEKKRPDSLVLAQNAVSSKLDEFSSFNQEQVQQVHQSQQTSEGRTTSAEVSPSFSSEEFAVFSSGRVRTGSDTSGLSELQGTLTVDGDLVTFVAEDLQEKIKMSSPVSRWTDSSSFPGSRSSTPSLYRQALQPSFHIIDPNVLTDLETHAKKVASCVDTMLENLSGTLQSISSLTVDCMETYESSVCKTCDAVDVNIKAVYQLMAKCEELSNAMNPLYKMSGDVKHIKKMLEQLEHIVEHKS